MQKFKTFTAAMTISTVVVSSMAGLNAYGESQELAEFVIEDGVLTEYTGDSELVAIPDTVTAIDEYSFYGKEKMKTVTIPASVTFINSSAFVNCGALDAFEVSEENEEYYSEDGVIYDKKQEQYLALFPCGRDGTYSVPDTVIAIGDGAFYSSLLERLEIPASVTAIGEGIVDFCSYLTEIEIAEENPLYASYDGIVYNKDKTVLSIVPPGIEGEHTILDTVKQLEEFAFYSCSGLTEINLPGDLEEIPMGAFAGCTGLSTIQLPDGLTSIGDRAFIGCTGLESIVIPEGVESIGYFVFTQCDNLSEIETDLLNSIFSSKDGVLFDASGDTLYAYPVGRDGDYEVPEGTKTIRQSAFFSAMGLGTVTVPDSVTEIEDLAFVMQGSDMRPENLKLKGSEDSAAQAHASLYEIPFEVE